MFVTMRTALDRLACGAEIITYVGVYSRWTLVQTWGTLRCSDHRGVHLNDVRMVEATFSTKLTRSKTKGLDKDVTCRPTVIDSFCYWTESRWMHAGWTLLKELAAFPRDYLMPAPTTNYQEFLKIELRYDTVYVIQNRVLMALIGADLPRAHHAFLDADIDKFFAKRNNISGRPDKFLEAASGHKQKLVVRSVNEKAVQDPLDENDTAQELDKFTSRSSVHRWPFWHSIWQWLLGGEIDWTTSAENFGTYCSCQRCAKN